MADNLYYLLYVYRVGSLTARPLRATLGGATGTTSAAAAAPPERFWHLSLDEDTCEALRLPVWAVRMDFLVFWAAFLAAVAAAFSAFSRSLTTLAFSHATRFSSAISLYKVVAAFSFFISPLQIFSASWSDLLVASRERASLSFLGDQNASFWY
jgi:hypothetical protein